MGNPTVTPITETRHEGGFIVMEPESRIDRDPITIASGAGVVTSGLVLGKKSVAGTAAAAALGANTGNGTFGAITVGAPAVSGAYTVEFDDATHYVVSSPVGAEVGHGTTAVAFSAGGLGFTITAGGTAFVPADSFTVTVAAGSGKFASFDPTAADGTEVAAGILYSGYRDATAADKNATGVVRGPVTVNASELVWGANVTTTPQKTAALATLAALGIVAR